MIHIWMKCTGSSADSLRSECRIPLPADMPLVDSSLKVSGGDAKTVNVKFIESDVEFVLNDGFNAVQRTFEMDADMIGTPAYEALKMLSETNADTIVRRRAKTGAISLIAAKIAFNEEETLTEGQAVVVKGTVNAQNLSTRYA